MARPKKTDPAKLTHHLPPVRCTGSEHALVHGKAKEAGLSCSEYVRRMATEGKIVVVEARTDFALTYEVKKTGVNLMQALKEFRYEGRRDPENLLQAIDKANRILDVALEDIEG